jgi:hypothetical protein
VHTFSSWSRIRNRELLRGRLPQSRRRSVWWKIVITGVLSQWLDSIQSRWVVHVYSLNYDSLLLTLIWWWLPVYIDIGLLRPLLNDSPVLESAAIEMFCSLHGLSLTPPQDDALRTSFSLGRRTRTIGDRGRVSPPTSQWHLEQNFRFLVLFVVLAFLLQFDEEKFVVLHFSL